MSIWKKEEYNTNTLNKNIEVNTLIIGGGLTGLLTAYFLNDTSSCVVEARTIGTGVTKNTTAKITYLQSDIYNKIKKLTNKENAKLYLNSQIESVKELKNLIEKEGINCDLKETPSYIFTSKKSKINKLKEEIYFLKKNGIKVSKSPLPIKYKNYSSYKVNDTYTFNPLKFITSLYEVLNKKNIKVYENTKVLNVKKENNVYICTTDNFTLKAKNIVYTTNYPSFVFPLLMPLRTSIEKSHIIVSLASKYKNFSCINIEKPTYSCRFYKENNKIYQISLGSSHNIAFKQNDNKCFDKVIREFKLNRCNIVDKYSNTDIITSDYMPLIGKIKNNMYISTGYNTWGMTNSILGAKIITNLIKNKQSEYSKLFNPKRINKSNIIKLPYYIFTGLYSYITSKIIKNKSWYKKNIKVHQTLGTDISVYIDEQGIEHKVKNKCPHLGCGLIFNEAEKCWDCPCHSSRFDIDGNCIKGPSNKNIKIK